MKTDTRKEDKRKSRKYRLLILLLLMFGTGILLTTSTYAWFTSNKTVSVSTLDVTIQAHFKYTILVFLMQENLQQIITFLYKINHFFTNIILFNIITNNYQINTINKTI